MTMLIASTLVSGWMPGASLSWWVLAVWTALVLAYGIARSRGDARQDPIRPSGPVG